VDQRFLFLTGWGNWGGIADISRIRNVLRARMFAELSAAEAFMFWRWRSEQYASLHYDASWLMIGDDDEVVEWFKKFLGTEEED